MHLGSMVQLTALSLECHLENGEDMQNIQCDRDASFIHEMIVNTEEDPRNWMKMQHAEQY